jgi:hypothetical protein
MAMVIANKSHFFRISRGMNMGRVSIAAPCVPVIAALMCTTKRRVEGVRILDFMELQKVK